MAGIGFELKRLFGKKGLTLNLRANLYASVVVAGPALLGAVLLLGINWLAYLAGAPRHERDLSWWWSLIRSCSRCSSRASCPLS